MATITFQVNLQTVNELGHKPPYTLADGANYAASRLAYFPDILRGNRELKHGVQFTVTGENALYLKNNFTTGTYKFLDVITEGL